jgi:hypothetical protein
MTATSPAVDLQGLLARGELVGVHHVAVTVDGTSDRGGAGGDDELPVLVTMWKLS